MKLDFSSVKVAIATDSMSSFGGADRLLLSLLKVFPQADIFTTIYNSKAYSEYNIKNKVHTSFIQYIPFLKRHLSFLYGFAFEVFDFKDFDLVISLSAGPAKGIITGVNQPHIAIILTPPRHQWDRDLNVRGSILRHIYAFASIFVTHYLRIWDISASKRSDLVITISRYIHQKIKKIYGRDSVVVYPGISKEQLVLASKEEMQRVKQKYNLEDDFVFVVSRLFDHKKIDWAIKACIENNQHLYISGRGPDEGFLKRIARGSKYIHFLGFVPDSDIKAVHAQSKAFIFPALEDFGYVTLEAMSQGIPVFCLNSGGSIEIVEKGKSGEYFSNISELSKLISKKAWTRYNPEEIRKRAREFTEEIFFKKLREEIQRVWQKN